MRQSHDAPQPDHTADERVPPDLVIKPDPPIPGALTPVEEARLAELLALPDPTRAQQTELADLQAKAAKPPLAPLTPDKVAPYILETLSHLVAIVESARDSVPALHSLGGRVDLARKAFDAATYHSAPPPAG